MKKNKLNTLHSYKKISFFMADHINISSYRDEIASMEHPFFSLKSKKIEDKIYKNKNIKITIRSNSLGFATIFDKDIWIYAISKLQEAINKNKPISKTIAFTPYNFFITTNRSCSGTGYKELKKALLRLKSTIIETNITYSNKKEETVIFGLIEETRILEKKKENQTLE